MPATGASDAITNATTGVLTNVDTVGTSLVSGDGVNTADLGSLASSGTNLIGTGVQTVKPNIGNAIINEAPIIGGATEAAVEGDASTALNLTNEALTDVTSSIVTPTEDTGTVVTNLDTTGTTTTVASTYTDPTTGIVYDLIPETATDADTTTTSYIDNTTGQIYTMTNDTTGTQGTTVNTAADTTTTDPNYESGDTTYAYDANGNLVVVTLI